MSYFDMDHAKWVASTTRKPLSDEVATINDSIPASATPQERWKKVNSWLRWKLRVLATARK